jgi:hypothetical protein
MSGDMAIQIGREALMVVIMVSEVGGKWEALRLCRPCTVAVTAHINNWFYQSTAVRFKTRELLAE